jgi:hypothetical protein
MAPHEADDFGQMGERRQDLRPDDRVRLDVGEFLVGERTLLVEDRLPDSDLADVVEPGRGAHGVDGFFGQPAGDRDLG